MTFIVVADSLVQVGLKLKPVPARQIIGPEGRVICEEEGN